ncbi:MAG: phage integrase N-terminal SAM-like domain-containing protein [Verrucomicrobiales bacterium]|nr:phage integrase N-terminal SAM-like domain-containing protein [Verrucomicrobiales bacterium]
MDGRLQRIEPARRGRLALPGETGSKGERRSYAGKPTSVPTDPKRQEIGKRSHPLCRVSGETEGKGPFVCHGKLLNLRHGSNRTRHSYYRDMRLVHQHFSCDPAGITESQFRNYILHVKNVKQWKPKTIRQTAASAKIFFLEMIGHEDWKVFSQIKTKDHDELPLVLTRPASHAS